ncbi:protein ROLLING AND ERECT LEAF 2 isoform X1 [Prosopis cineraria]|uniref:protein ROLLING AND ERECT LEAF 2 isoform X1 n=2 Tax=Prosopis cineraria TaxID=364024 RepID=UPI00241036F3|nr:protein ROLLING AND ERECT LEAF 2 isoform X1 [Prosopis cineraria]
MPFVDRGSSSHLPTSLYKEKVEARSVVMGTSSSKMEDDKALQLCRERKKFVRQALDGRCSLAAAHVSYVQSLKNTGKALRKFTEPEVPVESSLYTSTNATPEPLALTEKTLSQLSFSSPSVSQRIDVTETFSPVPSPPSSSKFQANHMKFGSSFSRKVEEKPPEPMIGVVTSSGTPQSATPHSTGRTEASLFEDSSLPAAASPWDFFGLYHPIDHQFSFQEGKAMYQEMGNGDDITQLREEEGIPELEDDEGNISSHGSEDSEESEDEFDEEPSTDTLVRRFENLKNRVGDNVVANAVPTTVKPLTKDQLSEELTNAEKINSASLSPLKAASTEANLTKATNKPAEKENHSEDKVAPKDFFSSMKEIEILFVKASESGKEVPRMLEANKLHFRPMFPAKEKGSVASSFWKACFLCGEDPSQSTEEPAQNSVKYLTWHRTASSRSSSSRNPLAANSKDDMEDVTSNLFDNFCMNSGSHASTLDRLYAWERKLYDEVKASGLVRREYDMKCKILRHMESKEEKTATIDKTRAVVKDLHSRIRVAIHRIDSISKRIEELRDKELQPQLEELIEGLSRMWEVMFECHKRQFQIISAAYNNSHATTTPQSEVRRLITPYLEHELHALSSSFAKWIEAQKSYLASIDGWLGKCVVLKQKSSKRKNRPPPLRNYGPPIYATCGVWLEKLQTLPTKDVTDSIKSLAAETARFLPRQEKKGANHPHTTTWKDDNGSESRDNLLGDDASEDWVSGFDRFRASLIRFLGQLNDFAGASVKMHGELRQAIQDRKNQYHRLNSLSQDGHLNSQPQDNQSKAQSQAV